MATNDWSQVKGFAARLPANSQKAIKGAQTIVAKTGHDAQRGMRGRAPRDTGNLRNSIALSTRLGGHQPSATITVGAHYGVYQEYGTYKMAAQPYVRPTMEALEPGFNSAVADLARQVLS